MRKPDAGYILWKIVIHLLVCVMTLVFCIPLALLLKSNGVEEHIRSVACSAVGFFLYVLFQYWLILRSNLSKISKKHYIIGEIAAFSVLTLFGAGVLCAVSRSLVPPLWSWWSFPFIPAQTFAYLLNNAVLGALLQIVCYAAAVLLLYAVKKSKDPTLCGPKKPGAEPEEKDDATAEEEENHD